MRELERDSDLHTPAPFRLTVVGRGRLGSALSPALRGAGYEVVGPLGRGEAASNSTVVLLCVPDGEIAAAASAISPGPIVGHCSGASRLDVLAPHEAFSLHPLMTVTDQGASFAGSGAAVAGTTPRALHLGEELARGLGMQPVRVAEDDRAAYHAAASIASNFLVTLEAAAERLAAGVGVEREVLVPLVRATIDNWARLGAEQALTGPVARGDMGTVAAQRQAVAERAPELVELFDALVELTHHLAAQADAKDPLSDRCAA